MQPVIKEPVQRIYSEFSLVGKKKQTASNEKTRETVAAIINIHRSVEWPTEADGLSIRRFRQDRNRSVFAVSPEGKILGYAVARFDGGEDYYISFIAVEKDSQKKGIGHAIILRLFEKIQKKGGNTVDVEFEDTPTLRKFYQNPSIPYESNFNEKIGKICCNTQDIYLDKNRVTYKLNDLNKG